MSRFEIAVFDVDGTLLDTREGVISSVQYTIQKHNLSKLTMGQLKTFIGPPIQKSFEKYYQLSTEEVQKLANTFRERYKTVDLLKAKPYEGIYETFDTLRSRGIKIAVATYKRQDYAIKILKHFGFDKYSNILYGADNENKLTKKDIIQKCMDDFGVKDYNRAVMIGDSDNDAIGAKMLGMNFIGVTYGFDFKTKEDVDKFPNIGLAHKPIEIAEFFK